MRAPLIKSSLLLFCAVLGLAGSSAVCSAQQANPDPNRPAIYLPGTPRPAGAAPASAVAAQEATPRSGVPGTTNTPTIPDGKIDLATVKTGGIYSEPGFREYEPKTAVSPFTPMGRAEKRELKDMIPILRKDITAVMNNPIKGTSLIMRGKVQRVGAQIPYERTIKEYVRREGPPGTGFIRDLTERKITSSLTIKSISMKNVVFEDEDTNLITVPIIAARTDVYKDVLLCTAVMIDDSGRILAPLMQNVDKPSSEQYYIAYAQYGRFLAKQTSSDDSLGLGSFQLVREGTDQSSAGKQAAATKELSVLPFLKLREASVNSGETLNAMTYAPATVIGKVKRSTGILSAPVRVQSADQEQGYFYLEGKMPNGSILVDQNGEFCGMAITRGSDLKNAPVVVAGVVALRKILLKSDTPGKVMNEFNSYQKRDPRDSLLVMGVVSE